MIFSLGKGKRKDTGDRPLEEEAIERWREISKRSRYGKETRLEGEGAVLDKMSEFDFDDEVEATRIKSQRGSLMSKISGSSGSKSPAWPETSKEVPSLEIDLQDQMRSEGKAPMETEVKLESEASEPEIFELKTSVAELSDSIETIKVSEPPKKSSAEKKPRASQSNQALERDLERRFGGNLKSALGPGTVVEGKFLII